MVALEITARLTVSLSATGPKLTVKRGEAETIYDPPKLGYINVPLTPGDILTIDNEKLLSVSEIIGYGAKVYEPKDDSKPKTPPTPTPPVPKIEDRVNGERK